MTNPLQTEVQDSTGYDEIEKRVLIAINAVQVGNRADIISAYEGLATLETGDVISELFLWVDDLTQGVDREELLQAVTLPIPDNPEVIIDSILNLDIKGLQSAVGSDRLESVLASLLVTVAALKDGRARLLSLKV